MLHKESTTIGITGDGQLARLAFPATMDLGLNTNVLGVHINNSVFRIMGENQAMRNGVIIGNKDWGDEVALRNFAELVGEGNPVTTEWENVPASTMATLESLGLIPQPGIQFLKAIQDRKTEKELAIVSGGTPVPFLAIEKSSQIKGFAQMNGGYPIVLKTRKDGYDGKGQWRINNAGEIDKIWEKANPNNIADRLIAEKMIDLDYEASVICARDKFGNVQLMGPIFNIHENGILRLSIDPAPLSLGEKFGLRTEAVRIINGMSSVVEGGYIGLLTIEMFVAKDGKIYVNEFAPRPHNSGHASLDAYGRDMSQNHLWLAAIAGKNISEMTPKYQKAIIMRNILSQSEMVQAQTQSLVNALSSGKGGITRKLYDYEKVTGGFDENDTTIRKVGHINMSGESIDLLISKCEMGTITREEFLSTILKTN